jgi:hypothetical protein
VNAATTAAAERAAPGPCASATNRPTAVWRPKPSTST